MISKKIQQGSSDDQLTREQILKLAEQICAKDRKALARGITLVESRVPAHRILAVELLSALAKKPKMSCTWAITGPPGVGKSSFVESIGLQALKKGHRLAVLSIDPTSAITKGSILGDKTRMHRLAGDERVFIRPSPSGGQLGGVASTTWEVRQLCQAAGYDLIFIETVGVGQSEFDVQHLSDMVILLLQPGSGDDIQGIKKGVMEMADCYVINKADGEQLKLAREAKSHVMAMLKLRSETQIAERVFTHSIVDEALILKCWEGLSSYMIRLAESGVFQTRHTTQNAYWFHNKVDAVLAAWVTTKKNDLLKQDDIYEKFERGELNIHDAINQFIFNFNNTYGN